MEVLRKMQTVLEEESLRELKNVLYMVFSGCEIVLQTDLQVIDDSWRIDLEDYLMSRALEGKTAETVKRYRYELTRILSYVNKPVANITDVDISGYLRLYKNIRKVKNSTPPKFYTMRHYSERHSQNHILRCLLFAHVVISPYKYHQMPLQMRAFDVHMIIFTWF